MILANALSLATELMAKHPLQDWSFKFDHAKRRFGCCNYTTKTISLSKHLCKLNNESQVRETLLHEIAHALTPGTHHGKKWQAKCIELGIKPERCYRTDDVSQPQSNYLLVCPHCNLQVPRHRQSTKTYVCINCCKRHNKGKLSKKYKLEWQRLNP